MTASDEPFGRVMNQVQRGNQIRLLEQTAALTRLACVSNLPLDDRTRFFEKRNRDESIRSEIVSHSQGQSGSQR